MKLILPSTVVPARATIYIWTDTAGKPNAGIDDGTIGGQFHCAGLQSGAATPDGGLCLIVELNPSPVNVIIDSTASAV